MKNFLLFVLLFIPFCINLTAQTDSSKGLYHFEKVYHGMNFPEGPAWDGKGNLYVSNCYGGWIARISAQKTDTFVTAASKPYSLEKTNGLTVYKDGNIYACEYGKGAILRFSPDGKCEPVCEGYMGTKFNRPNDLAFDRSGNLYFTDPKSYDVNNLDGIIYMIPVGKSEAVQVIKGLGFPNGIAFSPDGKFLFVCESAKQRILRFPVFNNGKFGDLQVFAELPGGDPDGIAFDSKGNLYVAHFGGAAVYVFSPEGKQLRKIPAPGKKPSNLEFAGNDLKTLYLTEDETNSVYKTTVEIPGSALFSSPFPQ